MSRQALYQRLRLIEQILGADLESGEDRAKLHGAVTALDARRSGRPGSQRSCGCGRMRGLDRAG